MFLVLDLIRIGIGIDEGLRIGRLGIRVRGWVIIRYVGLLMLVIRIS